MTFLAELRESLAFAYGPEHTQCCISRGICWGFAAPLGKFGAVFVHCEVYIYTSLGEVQTDLSYQYLENSMRLNEDVGRRERLDALKGASRFVEDFEARQLFARCCAAPQELGACARIGQCDAHAPHAHVHTCA